MIKFDIIFIEMLSKQISRLTTKHFSSSVNNFALLNTTESEK